MNFARSAVVIGLGVLIVSSAGAPPTYAQEATPAATPRPRYRRPGADRANQPDRRDLGRHEQAIRQGRNKIRQILRDPQASPQSKQTAAELNGLLDRRRQLIAQLKARHKSFVADHQADLNELTELARRAREVNARLDAARDETIRTSNTELAELKDISSRAATLADHLRTAYAQEQRARRAGQ